MNPVALLKKSLTFALLSVADLLSRKQSLIRIPEPTVSDNLEQVNQYDRVMESSLAIIYGVCLDFVRSCYEPTNDQAKIVDLCCGPGHFTKLLNSIYPQCQIHGVDLSKPMLKRLQTNLPLAKIHHDNITTLETLQGQKFELITAMNCIHHMADANLARAAFTTMESISGDDGVIFVVDVSRLKSSWQTKLYTDTFGMKSHPEFNFFHRDFELSMNAAWTTDELVGFVPRHSTKNWFLLSPLGFSPTVVLIGVPKWKKTPFLSRPCARHRNSGGRFSSKLNAEQSLFWLTFKMGTCHQLHTK